MEELEHVFEKIGEEADKTVLQATAEIDATITQELKGDQDIGTHLKKLDQELHQLNDTLSEFKSMFEKDSSYATGVLLMIGGAIVFMNSYESVWKTAGVVLAVGGVSVMLK